MTEWVKKEGRAVIPQGSGSTGLMRTMEVISKLPRVQNITVNARGEVTYAYLVRPGQAEYNIGIELASLEPYAVVRSCEAIKTLTRVEGENASLTITRLFRAVAVDHMNPIGFVVGTNSRLFPWFLASTGLDLAEFHDVFYGLPLYKDRHMPDETLVLCAGYLRGGALPDVTIAYSLVLEL